MATLVTLGIVCILAAIVGGGFKGLGIEIPIIRERSRQILLTAAGAILLSSAVAKHIIEIDPAKELESGISLYDAGNLDAALSHFRKASRLGNKEAEYHYGEMLFRGEGCFEDQDAGLRHLVHAANGGNAHAQAAAAHIYLLKLQKHEESKDLKDHLLWGTVWAGLSADQNDPMGLRVLAQFVKGTKRLNALSRSAQLGYAPAQYELAMDTFPSSEGTKGITPASKSALIWLDPAAVQGHREAIALKAIVEFATAKSQQSGSSERLDSLRRAYKLADLAANNHFDNLFPLSESSRKRCNSMKDVIETELPPQVIADIILQNASWQPKRSLPYRHGEE